ncbi:non-ribosomal peptide synthetase [Actinophytocola oryzae]|uniref:Amino acid adenylation domain-containing protein n=1 Tax=Actinophytocola oryzae TaxID=502181 RepID=A0A4V3FRE5_9PSEU|nr:non-ribosomal peptide synthetase [Actinophytocola oryzae]TDV43181.1 amino acid adenylation domain-containing protein [Actinophytocola oryzae]
MPSPDTSQPIPVRPRAARSGSADVARARRALLDLRARRAEIDRTDIVPVPRDRMLPLSSAQQRLWFLDQLMHGQPVYNAPTILRVRGPLDPAALRDALTSVVRRHEVLRTRYPTERGVPHQVIDPPPEQVDLPVVEVATEDAAREELTRLARTTFDLERGPVLCARLVRIAADDHLFGLCVHHIATDGWSNGVMIQELLAGYDARCGGTGPGLPDLPVQYADYAVWQRERFAGDVLDRQIDYWRARLADLPVLNLPTDHPRPPELSFRGTTFTTDLPDRLRVELTDLARREQATLLSVLLAAFTALLTRHTSQHDIVVGSLFSGRTMPAIDPLLGFFANTLVLRTSTAGDPTFRELLTRARETVLGAHLNQEVDFDRLVAEISPDRDPSRNPLFQVCFTLQDAMAGRGSVGGLTVTQEAVQVGTSRFDLAVHITELVGQGLQLWMEFSTELFEEARIRRLAAQFARVLDQVVANPDVRVGELSLLGPEEHAAALGHARAPVSFDRADRCLHELVQEQAEATPDAPACRYLGITTSYGELNARANRLARVLRDRYPGLGAESVVGVLLDRGPALTVALLATLKAGGAYLPIDPTFPPERVEYAVRDAGCVTVLTTGRLAGLLSDDVPVVSLDHPDTMRAMVDLPADDLPTVATTGSAAYVIYTSGSTGRPKGVVVEHRQIVNFTLAVIDMFRLKQGDRVLQFANPAFDTAAFDFYGALASGATMIQAPTGTLHHPGALENLMRNEGVTVTDLPPTVLAMLDPDRLPDLRALFVGMEPFPAELVNNWNGSGREFHNGYGPTEATVACIDYLCPDGVLAGVPPIGLPMANNTAYVLDEFGQVAPPGVSGELYVGGAGVARGYLGRPGLTADRFVPAPHGPPGTRLYRTGDLARRDENGILVFQGRADSQIKIRGMRIEPAEIEAALLDHPDVHQAVVVAVTDKGAARLVAYLLPVAGAKPTPAEVRGRLVDRLPLFMVPTAFVVVPAFPKNAHGKIDRARLPAPQETGEGGAPGHVAPRTETERRLVDLWRETLGVDEVSVDDDFFAVGGNSMRFVQIAARIREAFDVSLELRTLFTTPTVAGLAEALDGRLS